MRKQQKSEIEGKSTENKRGKERDASKKVTSAACKVLQVPVPPSPEDFPDLRAHADSWQENANTSSYVT